MSKEFTYTFRAIWFIVRTILILAVVALLALFCFRTAQQLSGIYVIVTEGMETRANVVMHKKETNEMVEYFSTQFIQDDPLLSEKKYADYYITNFNYMMRVKSINVLPWSKSASVVLEDRVTGIFGGLSDTAKAALQTDEQEPPMPQWVNCRYKINLIKDDANRWYISDIQTEQVLVEEKETNTQP